MVVVLVFVALATILSYALLSSQSTMMQASDNSARSAQADALAESGVQLAAYYLQNPAAAPVLNSSGYYPGQTGVSLGSAVNGTVDITVTQVNTSTYDISSKAHYAATSASSLNRSLGARASVQFSAAPTDAMAINGGLTIPSTMTINGNLRANGNIKLNGGKVTGTITAPSVVNLLGTLIGLVDQIVTDTSSNKVVATTVKDYRTYTYNGKTYSAQLLPGTSGTIGPTANNPLGVYYGTGDVTVSTALTINGTLLVPEGKLIMKSTKLTINASVNMPALVVNSDIGFSGTKRSLTVNGLAWIGGAITKSGTTSNNDATFNGAVQFSGGGGGVSTNYSGTVVVNYDKNRAATSSFVPGQAGTVASGIKLTSFSNK